MNARGWLALLLILGVLDVTTYAVAPQDAWNPLHPHPAQWSKRPLVPHVRMHVVCWVHKVMEPPTGCFHETGKGK